MGDAGTFLVLYIMALRGGGVPKARHVNNREGGPPPGTQGAVTLLHSSDEILYWLRVVNREEVRGRGESP